MRVTGARALLSYKLKNYKQLKTRAGVHTYAQARAGAQRSKR